MVQLQQTFSNLTLEIGQVTSNEDQSGLTLGAQTEIVEGDNQYDNYESI